MVLSHLLWNTGQVMLQLPPSAHQNSSSTPNSPFLLVDAAQSFGQIPIDEAAAAADIYAFTGHNGPAGQKDWEAWRCPNVCWSDAAPTVIGWRSLRDESQRPI